MFYWALGVSFIATSMIISWRLFRRVSLGDLEVGMTDAFFVGKGGRVSDYAKKQFFKYIEKEFEDMDKPGFKRIKRLVLGFSLDYFGGKLEHAHKAGQAKIFPYSTDIEKAKRYATKILNKYLTPSFIFVGMTVFVICILVFQ
ncbi:hypothetical protein ACFL24_00760 [Patescibacteria group bacterium]